MQTYDVRVHPSAANLPREEQLAWHIADFAAHCGPIDADVAEMISCRIVDNASVALAAIKRAPVAAARAMALAHPRKGGGTLYGLDANPRRRRMGRLGPPRRSASWISTTPSSPPITRIRAIPSRH